MQGKDFTRFKDHKYYYETFYGFLQILPNR